MFCPTCGAFAPSRAGDGKTFYERIDSQESEEWKAWQEKKPQPRSLHVLNAKKDWRYHRNNSTFEEDKQVWETQNRRIERYTKTARGKELMETDVDYLDCSMCPYHGPINPVIIDGKKNLEAFTTSTEVIDRVYEIGSDRIQNMLTIYGYACPKCSSDKIYSQSSRLEFGEVQVTFLDCSICGHA
ncbi:hypothetical protein, partial [Poseidonia sp.]|uniref:hypothetical protein n=1 Tax=Poseidonia sp. TaxID=2666344 RepID=UPI003F6959B4